MWDCLHVWSLRWRLLLSELNSKNLFILIGKLRSAEPFDFSRGSDAFFSEKKVFEQMLLCFFVFIFAKPFLLIWKFRCHFLKIWNEVIIYREIEIRSAPERNRKIGFSILGQCHRVMNYWLRIVVWRKLHTVEQVENVHQKLLRFCSQAARKTQHFLVRVCNLFDSVNCQSATWSISSEKMINETFNYNFTKYLLTLTRPNFLFDWRKFVFRGTVLNLLDSQRCGQGQVGPTYI